MFKNWRPEYVLMGIVGLVTVALVSYPVVFLVQVSLNAGNPQDKPIKVWGVNNYAGIFDHLDWLWNSITVSAAGTIGAVLFGLVLAWIINRTTIPGRRVFEQLVIIPFYVTPIVGALAWSLLGSPKSGIVNKVFQMLSGTDVTLINAESWLGIAWVEALYEGSVAFVMISAAMKSMDPALEESSEVLGAGRLHTALRVTIPMLTPAVLGAAIFVFVALMGSFSAAVILGFPARFYVVTTAIWMLLARFPPNYPLAAAMGLSLFAFTAGAMAFYYFVIRGKTYTTITGKAFRPRLINMRGWTPVLFGVCCFYVLVAVVLPIGSLIYVSFLKFPTTVLKDIHWTLYNYDWVLIKHAPTRIALTNSLLLAVATATIGIVFMGILAWMINRTNIRGRHILDYVAMFPQAVPRMVFSLGLLWAWIVMPIGVYGTLWILLLCYITVFLPLGVRAISGVVVQLDKSVEECARVCGASWVHTLRTVTLPLLRPGVMAAWVLIFIVAIREIGGSILLISAKSKVIGPAIIETWESSGMQLTSALVLVQTAVILIALLIAARVAGKRFEEME